MYRIDAGKKIFYALTDDEKDEIITNLNGSSYEIGRFKGLGEMPASDLRETTMSKKTRSLIRVALGFAEQANKTVCELMGKNAESRFKFIKEKAEFVQDLDV